MSSQTLQNNENINSANANSQETEINNQGNETIDLIDGENIKENLNQLAEGITEKIGSTLHYIKPLGPVFIPNIFYKFVVIICFLFGVGSENHWQALGLFWFSLATLTDFWFVKKVAFRRQVCVNYSCKTDTNGDHLWSFEKLQNQMPTKMSKYCFWIVEDAFIIILCIFDIASLVMLKFAWVFIVSISIFAFSINIYLMNRCDNDFEIAVKKEAFNILQNKVIPMISASIPESNNEEDPNNNEENLQTQTV